ncbi:hypothetical protein [Natrinema halophilum]|uniref:Uncharacterized protein n=1 Tax=Natrinema halophilum TaxID=1699371 RepID=A0A7D5GM49_9EURY|nr:hypothetical protein [Natrinema halophilum]QLG50470.1 hypothetical protein HYG82_17250 [Natrinema halophilum]
MDDFPTAGKVFRVYGSALSRGCHRRSRKIDEEFLVTRNERLREYHNWMDAADVAGAALHHLGSKERHEEIFGHDHHNNVTTVYGDADTGTIAELRRYAHRIREKSTTSSLPELPSSG